MKKFVVYIAAALCGVCLGIAFHCSFMVVESKGCMMLPTIEPAEKVIVWLNDYDIEEGDVVAFVPEYYTLEGEGNIIFRRVEAADDSKLILTCDASLVDNEELSIDREDILGKVIFPK